MARQQSIEMSAINVTIHPHSAERYADLLIKAVRLQRAKQQKHNFLKVRGETKAIFRPASPLRKDVPTEGIQGAIAKFVDIGPDDEWLSLDTEELVDASAKPKVTADMKPYRSEFNFVFFPKDHRIVFETRHTDGSVATSTTARLFEEIFRHPAIVKEFGEVNVTVQQSVDGLKEVFSLPHLSHVEIVLTRPNGDTGGDLEKAFQDFLADTNGNKAKLEVTGQRSGDGINTNNSVIKAASAVALSNGYVSVRGTDPQGVTKELSTTSHPFVHTEKFDPDKMGRRTAFQRFAQALVSVDLSPKLHPGIGRVSP